MFNISRLILELRQFIEISQWRHAGGYPRQFCMFMYM